jgi:curved DNA-binding protein CbpA
MKTPRVRTLYTWLGIEEDATRSEIKKAYRDQAKIHHPDRGGDTDRFSRIQQAYHILMDPNKRARYDMKVKRTRMKLKVQAIRDSAFSKLREMWDEEEREYQQTQENRKNSGHARYFEEQDRLEAEWASQYGEMMDEYHSRESLNTENLRDILRTTDEILSSMEGSGRVRIPNQTIRKSPINLKVESEVELGDQAQHIVSDLRDTIIKAERLVRIFNRLTGAVK